MTNVKNYFKQADDTGDNKLILTGSYDISNMTGFINDDTFATATITTAASSASIKAYVDAQVGGENHWDRVTGTPNYLKTHNAGDNLGKSTDLLTKIWINEIYCENALTYKLAIASRILANDSNQQITNVDLSSWILGTANQVTVTDDTAGGVALSLPQSIATTSDVTFNSVIGTANLKVGILTLNIISGTGTPQGSALAPKGSIYMRYDGSTTNDRAYINLDGSVNWTPIITAS